MKTMMNSHKYRSKSKNQKAYGSQDVKRAKIFLWQVESDLHLHLSKPITMRASEKSLSAREKVVTCIELCMAGGLKMANGHGTENGRSCKDLLYLRLSALSVTDSIYRNSLVS